MRRMMIATMLAATMFTMMKGAPARAATFVFTAIPDQDPRRLTERFGRVATYLAQALHVKVRYVPVTSYPAAVTEFVNDEVQLAWFGGVTGVEARARVPRSRAIAQGLEDRAFHAYLIANASTGLTRANAIPDAVRGKTFTFGARSSTSGRVMPQYFLRQRFHASPEALFSRVGYSGDHTKTIQLVQSGAYDLGAVDYSVWSLEVKAGHVDPSRVRVIWESPPFPDYQWTVRGDLDARFGAGFTARLAAALTGITDPAILSIFARSRFVPADNADYAPVEAVLGSDGPAR